jgi:FkbM family methyltransferase
MGIRDTAPFQRLRFWARAVKYARTVDPHEIRFLRRLLRPGDFAIDVGAHKGGYLHWLQRAVGPTGRVVAFEPQPAAAAYLLGITALLGYRHVEIVASAVSDREGPVTLFAPSSRVSTGATLEAGLFAENDAANRIEAVTLDGYLGRRPELPPPRFIKIDVETHELAVLHGAERVLRTARPAVQFEADQHVYGDRPIAAIFEYLRGLGLEGYFFFAGALHPVGAFRVTTHQPAALRRTPNHPGFANNFLFLDAARERALLQRYGITAAGRA